MKFRVSFLIPVPFVAGLLAPQHPAAALAVAIVLLLILVARPLLGLLLFVCFCMGMSSSARSQQTEAHYAEAAQALRGQASGTVTEVTPSLRIRVQGNLSLQLAPVTPSVGIHPGDRIHIQGVIEVPSNKRNPFDFDEAAYLAGRGVHGRVRSLSHLVVEHGSHDDFLLRRWRTQMFIASRIEFLYGTGGISSLVRAMILGQRFDISAPLKSSFKASGLMHLLAISGLHFGCIAGIVSGITSVFTRRLCLRESGRRWLNASLVSFFLLLFMLLVGASASVLRSFVMGVLSLVAWALRRKNTLLSALSVAFVAILVLDPAQISGVGFLLSFSAVFGIALAIRIQHRFKPVGRILSALRAAIWISFCATLSTAPVVLYTMGSVPLVTLLLSPLSIALTTLALSLSVASLVLPLVGPALATLSSFLFGALIHVAAVGSVFTWMPTWVEVPGIANPLSFLLWLLLVLAAVRAVRARLFYLYFVLIFGAVVSLQRHGSPLLVSFLDVGQGDAVVLLAPKSDALIVDTGPGRAGGRAVVQHLSAINADGKTTLLLTHPHLDHIGGAESVLEKIPIERLWHASNITFAFDNSVSIRRGHILRLGESSRLYVLHPSQSGNENDDSVVLLLVFGKTRFLLLGDAEKKTEQELLKNYVALLRADVVKVGHHGSNSSSSLELVQSLASSYAVISAGKNNRFSHPDSAIVRRWINSGARVVSTLNDGAVLFESDGNTVKKREWRE